ncbi:hypothetical protein ACWGK7_19100 (plasmid) [Sphingomonas aurantiaca]
MISIDSRSMCATAALSFCRHSRHWQAVWQVWDTRCRGVQTQKILAWDFPPSSHDVAGPAYTLLCVGSISAKKGVGDFICVI